MMSAQAKKEKILDNLRASVEPLTLGSLARVCHYPKSTVAYHVRRLAERGEIVRQNGGLLLGQPPFNEGVFAVNEHSRRQLEQIERYAVAKKTTVEAIWRLAREFFKQLEPELYDYFMEKYGDPEKSKDAPPEEE